MGGMGTLLRVENIYTNQRTDLARYKKKKRTCLEKSFPLDMLSAVILSQRSYLTMLRAKQLVHQRLVRSNPLVLRTGFLGSFARTPGRIQTVSRM